MSRQTARRPGRRWFTAAMVALVGASFLAGLWACNRPEQRKRRGLDMLAAHDWTSVQYAELTLPQTPEYRPARYLLAGALALERREFIPALRDLRFAAGDPAIQAWAWLLSGEALYAQRRFREAELNFKHAIELDPDLTDAYRWMAIAYYDVGLLNEALVYLDRVAELDPHDPRPHRLMALIYMERGGEAFAVEDLQEALRRDPNLPEREDALAELALCQIQLNRWEDAQQTLATCSATPEVWAMQAVALYALGEGQEAKRLAQKALDAAGDEVPLALSVLGKLAVDERRYDDAIGLLTRGAEAVPSDYQVQYSLLTALRTAGRSDEAEKQLAAVESLKEATDRFESLLQQAEADPYDAELRYQLGLVAGQLGLPGVMTKWMKAAVILDPNHLPALAELKKHGAAPLDAAKVLSGG
jgi:tetratricopeptide (TPR) repeat protein